MPQESRSEIIFRIAFAAGATAISCAIGYWLVVILMIFPLGAVAFIFLSCLFGIPAKAFPYIGMGIGFVTSLIWWCAVVEDIKKLRGGSVTESRTHIPD